MRALICKVRFLGEDDDLLLELRLEREFVSPRIFVCYLFALPAVFDVKLICLGVIILLVFRARLLPAEAAATDN